MFPIPCIIVFILVNSTAWANESTAALPFGTIMVLVSLFVLGVVPLSSKSPKQYHENSVFFFVLTFFFFSFFFEKFWVQLLVEIHLVILKHHVVYIKYHVKYHRCRSTAAPLYMCWLVDFCLSVQFTLKCIISLKLCGDIKFILCKFIFLYPFFRFFCLLVLVNHLTFFLFFSSFFFLL